MVISGQYLVIANDGDNRSATKVVVLQLILGVRRAWETAHEDSRRLGWDDLDLVHLFDHVDWSDSAMMKYSLNSPKEAWFLVHGTVDGF